MTVRATVLFTPDGRAAPGLIRLWRDRAATQPIMVGARLLEEDRSATRTFRALWDRAFSSRDPLPFSALGLRDGTGTDDFWRVFE